VVELLRLCDSDAPGFRRGRFAAGSLSEEPLLLLVVAEVRELLPPPVVVVVGVVGAGAVVVVVVLAAFGGRPRFRVRVGGVSLPLANGEVILVAVEPVLVSIEKLSRNWLERNEDVD
jgi:hypothetical protein